MGFFSENWFWRGTQSAIFYYVSCAPCLELKYKRKRRNEAARAEKHKSAIIATQPGLIQQPGAFQTNEDWVEEILMGPGPPKGWKRDPIVEKAGTGDKQKHGTLDEIIERSALSPEMSNSIGAAPVGPCAVRTLTFAEPSQAQDNVTDHVITSDDSPVRNGSRRSTDTSSSSAASNRHVARARPSLERRLSTAMDNLRDTLRSTIRTEHWNWIRYDRDDEILSGFNQRMTKMWDKATNFTMMDKSEDNSSLDNGSTSGRLERSSTNDSDHFDYRKYVRNPEINELHPPVVSRLPATRDDAAWMILPPPSAAIMEGKTRPQDDTAMRWPLARIGRTPQDWQELAEQQELERQRTNGVQIEPLPELSDSHTESSLSDEESLRHSTQQRANLLVSRSDQPSIDLAFGKGRSILADRNGWVSAG